MKKRIEWIDSLRGLAMFFVILGHAFTDHKNVIRNYIYSFHMPLFFFISGLTYKKKDISFKDYLKSKCKGLLLPYLFINIFVLLIKYGLSLVFNVYKNINLLASFKAFIKGFGSIPCIQSWFLLTLLLVDIMFYLLKKIFKDDKQLTVGVLLIFTLGYYVSKMKFSFDIPWHANTALIALIYYYGGYMFMKYIDKYKFILESKWSYLIILIAFPIAYYLQAINGRVSMNANNYKNIFLFLSSSFVTIVSLVVLINLAMNKDKLFKGVGINSMFYLGYHAFLLTLVGKYIPILLSNNLLTILTSFLDLLILYPIGLLVAKRIPIMVGKLPKRKKLDNV